LGKWPDRVLLCDGCGFLIVDQSTWSRQVTFTVPWATPIGEMNAANIFDVVLIGRGAGNFYNTSLHTDEFSSMFHGLVSLVPYVHISAVGGGKSCPLVFIYWDTFC
jgi:hypothetical protein